jgi:iron complex transport system substrate-binding protein
MRSVKEFLGRAASGLALALAACTPDDAAAGLSGPSGVPAAAPHRILPANAAWIDFASLLVGPERVVAVPSEAFGYSRLSDAPEEERDEWRALPSLALFEAERILALAPDLVLAHEWQKPETLASLRAAGIPVLLAPVPRSWDEILRTLLELGAALGETPRATARVAELEARRARLAERAARFAHLDALSYTNLGAGGWTSGSGTTGEILLALAGLGNAAAKAGLVGDVPAEAERLLALAPDVFLVGRPDRSESAPPSQEFLLAQPALAQLEALRARRIASLPPQLFTSASPELLTGAERLVDALEAWERAGALPPPR